ncbi:MAG: 2-iminoacetate synthase ThiH [Bacillaceae bacterium]|nr:2-iminoacetate synthase ThiH [Bacillaceae bacterium]
MSFYDEYISLKTIPFQEFFDQITPEHVWHVLNKTDPLTNEEFLILLSPKAEHFLEEMAQKAHQLTVQHFGRTMQLFLPLYLTDYCVNKCKYCSFSFDHVFPRTKLTLDEIEKEAKVIKKKGIEHIILLTGESRIHSSVGYLKEAAEILKNYFSSISLEVQPLKTEEYRVLIEAGIDGLTVYQEVYNEDIYKDIHVKGPKRNYRFRLDTPERGCRAGMRSVNIGALLGLDDWRKEVFFTGMHAKYLQDNYLDTEISVSFPRLKPHLGSFQPNVHVTDIDLVQAMLAYRLFMPRSGITISTREAPELRNHLIPLGVTKMSAESSTTVGGYSKSHTGENSQFELSDHRTVEEIKQVLRDKGYHPVMKDWEILI